MGCLAKGWNECTCPGQFAATRDESVRDRYQRFNEMRNLLQGVYLTRTRGRIGLYRPDGNPVRMAVN